MNIVLSPNDLPSLTGLVLDDVLGSEILRPAIVREHHQILFPGIRPDITVRINDRLSFKYSPVGPALVRASHDLHLFSVNVQDIHGERSAEET